MDIDDCQHLLARMADLPSDLHFKLSSIWLMGDLLDGFHHLTWLARKGKPYFMAKASEYFSGVKIVVLQPDWHDVRKQAGIMTNFFRRLERVIEVNGLTEDDKVIEEQGALAFKTKSDNIICMNREFARKGIGLQRTITGESVNKHVHYIYCNIQDVTEMVLRELTDICVEESI